MTKSRTRNPAAARPQAKAPQQAPAAPAATPPAPEAPAPADDASAGAPGIEVPELGLVELLAWVADAGTQDVARQRADALYAAAQSSEEFTEAELTDVSGALTTAVYGIPNDSTTADAADGPLQVPPPVVVDQTPDAGDATGVAGGASEEVDPAAQRAAALAALTGGGDADGEFSPGGSEDEPAPLPVPSGVVHEWGGSVRYIVLGFLFNAIVDGRHLTAYHGDVLHMTEEGAARGLEHRNIAPLDD